MLCCSPAVAAVGRPLPLPRRLARLRLPSRRFGRYAGMPGGGDRCASHVLRSNQGSAAVVAMHAERHSPPLRHRPTVSPHPPFKPAANRSEEHTSELQSLMRISYAVFCLKKKKNKDKIITD